MLWPGPVANVVDLPFRLSFPEKRQSQCHNPRCIDGVTLWFLTESEVVLLARRESMAVIAAKVHRHIYSVLSVWEHSDCRRLLTLKQVGTSARTATLRAQVLRVLADIRINPQKPMATDKDDRDGKRLGMIFT